MPPRSNWEPPYPAFSADFDDGVDRVVMAYYGVDGDAQDRAHFADWLLAMCQAENRPVVVNRASYTAKDGRVSDVFILYWLDSDAFYRWEQRPEIQSWWLSSDRLIGTAGYWREVWSPPLSYLETLISSTEPVGLAEAKTAIGGPVREHAYWGAARDRIPVSASDALNPEMADLEPSDVSPKIASLGRRLRVRPAGNVCLIRSGQNWTDCGPEELDLYMEDVYPVFRAGMNFLRDNPLETGCLSCRFMEQLTIEGETQQKTFATAAFLSLGHLERWAKSHPTHLAIFKSFHELVHKRNFAVDLKLWHEVAVMPAGASVAEYINCRPETGLLPYLAAETF